MYHPYTIPAWKSAPFLRLLLPLICGIIYCRYLPLPIMIAYIFILSGIILFFLLDVLSPKLKFRFRYLRGALLNLVLFFVVAAIMYQKDIRNDPHWFGHFYTGSSELVLRITEPPVEKANSFKAEALAEEISVKGKLQKTCGKILLYFSKTNPPSIPHYGDRILIRGGLQSIRNSGNPGAFDYKEYMEFQQVFHQAFIKKGRFVLLNDRAANPIYSFIFSARDKIIAVLKDQIQGDKKVTGITEALLIGYKEDLDPETVQAYSNTGVVHIIAISGMHLGLIYVVLVWLFSRLPYIKKAPLLRVLLILSCLWLFSLITGASASVIRSAVMFTCIITGKTFFRQASMYNSLATSAFLLLCYDPYLLWDVGFQLSYLAVIGIVWLQKPIFNSWYTKHLSLQKIWELTAISLAAQVLTLPICIYYFHRIPTTFLISNLVCVPLSTIILFAEIAVLTTAFSNYLGMFLGKFTYTLTWLMNAFINLCNALPFSLIDNIRLSPIETIILYVAVILLCHSLLQKKRKAFAVAMMLFVIFTGMYSCDRIISLKQKKIVVYHINKHTAIDLIAGNKYLFAGDEELKKDKRTESYLLWPSRVSLQAFDPVPELSSLKRNGMLWELNNKRLLIVDTAIIFAPLAKKIKVDILLVSHNPQISLSNIICAVSPAIIVFDGSNSLWKIGQLKKECERLNLHCYSTAEQGAYILDAAAQ